MNNNHTPLQNDDQKSTTSAPLKESEPVGVTQHETIRPIEEPELGKEVVDYLKKTDESLKKKVAPDLKALGLTITDDMSTTTGPVFSISDEKIEEGLRQPVNSSWRWLSELLLYHLKQMHFTLKKVHGHIVRVARG